MKKLTISSDELKPALAKLGQLVHESSILPATKNIYLIVGKNEVDMITTDMETFISCKCVAETDPKQEVFELLIPFDYLNDIVKNGEGNPVTIEHPSSRKARFICGRDEYNLDSLVSPDEFPKVPSVPKKPMHTLTGQFVVLLAKALLTVGKNHNNPVMTRVCLDMIPGDVNLVSTDTYVMYKHKLPLEITEAAQLQFSAKTIKAVEGMESVELSWNKSKICMKSEKLTVWSQLHEGKYPNYKSIIPTYEPNLEVAKDDLTGALKKSLISKVSTNSATLFPKKSADTLLFEAHNPENGRKIHTPIAGSYTGEVDEVAISAKKLLVILDQIEGQKIRLHLQVKNKAILVSCEEDPDYLGLIMPIIPTA